MADATTTETVRPPVALTVRLSAPIHELVSEEAARDGISISQFIRETVLIRCVWRRGHRGQMIMPAGDRRTVEAIIEQLHETLDGLQD